MIAVVALSLSACSGGRGSFGSLAGGLFGGKTSKITVNDDVLPANATAGTPPPAQSVTDTQPVRRGFFGGAKTNPDNAIRVNKYIWSAALDVLDFLPLQSADPFTGVITTGFGTPPGGGRAYRATILIQDPALDARSLHVSLSTRRGPASAATIRAVEDAILARARQLRLGHS